MVRSTSFPFLHAFMKRCFIWKNLFITDVCFLASLHVRTLKIGWILPTSGPNLWTCSFWQHLRNYWCDFLSPFFSWVHLQGFFQF